MKIVVMGTGGVGGYYGGLFASQGHDVFFVARGAHLKAIQEQGLQIFSVHGDFTVHPVNAGEDPAEFGIADLVLFCTKTYDTEQSARQLLPVMGPQTMVMSFQNGVDSAERIGAVLGMQHMIGSATWISSMIEQPGVIRQLSMFRRVAFGELDGKPIGAYPGALPGLVRIGHRPGVFQRYSQGALDEIHVYLCHQRYWQHGAPVCG